MNAAGAKDTMQVQKPRAKSGLWFRQFDSVYDFPETEIKTKYVLCTTPRCGSHFIGHMMHQTGDLGYPLEYCNRANWNIWVEKAKEAGYKRPLDYIKSIRTGPNGVFGLKLHHEHLELFLEQEPDPLSYLFIHITRDDVLRQAISFARAQQTNAWISDMEPTGDAYYDYDLFAEKVQNVTQGNANWQAFLAATGSRSLPVTYEQTRDNPQNTLDNIAKFLHVKLAPEEGAIQSFQPRVQSKTDDPAADWAERFISESKARINGSDLAPGMTRTPALTTMKREARATAKSILKRLR